MITARRRHVALVALLLLVLTAMSLGPTPSSAADGDWWEPTVRPAPDSGIGVTGEPFTGTDARGEVRGFVDAHNHIMLAKNAPATASSTEWNPFTSYAPGRAVDGDRGTRWASDWSDDQRLRIDLGSTREVGRVTLDRERAYGTSYRIELSTDGSNWRTAWSAVSGDGGLDTARFAPEPARHVRPRFLDRGTDWGCSLREVGVHRS